MSIKISHDLVEEFKGSVLPLNDRNSIVQLLYGFAELEQRVANLAVGYFKVKHPSCYDRLCGRSRSWCEDDWRLNHILDVTDDCITVEMSRTYSHYDNDKYAEDVMLYELQMPFYYLWHPESLDVFVEAEHERLRFVALEAKRAEESAKLAAKQAKELKQEAHERQEFERLLAKYGRVAK